MALHPDIARTLREAGGEFLANARTEPLETCVGDRLLRSHALRRIFLLQGVRLDHHCEDGAAIWTIALRG